MVFTNPLLALGAALFLVPLIIHLLNRQRFRRRRWAAMEFLMRAYRKQRRRLRRENILLLLLRCLIPILLALAIARPRFEDSIAGGLLGSTAHHVFVFDESYSMGLQNAGRPSPYERGRNLASTLLDRIASREGHKVSVLVAGVRPRQLMSEELNMQRAKAQIASLPAPPDSSQDLTAALTRAAELVEEGGDEDQRVYLFTDLQVRAFGLDPFAEEAPVPGDAPATAADEAPSSDMFEDTVRDAMERIRAVGELKVFDLRGRNQPNSEDNLQLRELVLGQPHAIARVALPLVATVQNRGSSAQVVQVTLEIDGEQPQRSSKNVPAGGEAEIEFDVTFQQTGQRRVRAYIEGDDLVADDERFLVANVRERLRVLVVEGTEEQDPSLRESTLLRDILDPTGGEGSPELTVFLPNVIETVSLLSGRERLELYDLIVLANVERLNETAANALATAVDQGAGLLVMLGDRVDVASYNRLLHDREPRLMPLRLTEEKGYAVEDDSYYVTQVRRSEHPMFGDFVEDIYLELFQALPVWRFVGTEDPRFLPEEQRLSVDVLATLSDPNLSPLLFTGSHGAGKTCFLTSSISRRPGRWNRLEFQAGAVTSYLFLLLHPMAYWLTLPTTDAYNVTVGAALSATVDERPFDIAVLRPERAGLGKVPIGDEATPLVGDRYALPPYRNTEYGGFYQVDMLLDQRGGSQAATEQFAVNPDPIEGALEYYAHARFEEEFGVAQVLTELPAEGRAIQAGTSELGPFLLWLTLFLIVGEAAMARWIARRRT